MKQTLRDRNGSFGNLSLQTRGVLLIVRGAREKGVFPITGIHEPGALHSKESLFFHWEYFQRQITLKMGNIKNALGQININIPYAKSRRCSMKRESRWHLPSSYNSRTLCLLLVNKI